MRRQSCPMARRDKLWSFCAFCHLEAASPMTCRDKLWSFCSPFRHSETIVSDGTQRQIMVILRLLSSRGGEPDDMRRKIMVISLTFSPFGDNRVRWPAETNYGHSAHLFAFRRQSCPMARKDKLWSFYAFCHPKAASLMTCRDKLWSFRSPFRHSETIVSDGT
ncbi:hypothetical protein HKD37_07G018825 [Glycine soja]